MQTGPGRCLRRCVFTLAQVLGCVSGNHWGVCVCVCKDLGMLWASCDITLGFSCLTLPIFLLADTTSVSSACVPKWSHPRVPSSRAVPLDPAMACDPGSSWLRWGL